MLSLLSYNVGFVGKDFHPIVAVKTPFFSATKINKMKLKDMSLTDPADQIQLSTNRENFVSYVRNGTITNGVVQNGVTMGGGKIFRVETRGEEEFILFNVFLAKIRRENQGLHQCSTKFQREWYDMTKQFVDEFGEERTPPDVIDALQIYKENLGL